MRLLLQLLLLSLLSLLSLLLLLLLLHEYQNLLLLLEKRSLHFLVHIDDFLLQSFSRALASYATFYHGAVFRFTRVVRSRGSCRRRGRCCLRHKAGHSWHHSGEGQHRHH